MLQYVYASLCLVKGRRFSPAESRLREDWPAIDSVIYLVNGYAELRVPGVEAALNGVCARMARKKRRMNIHESELIDQPWTQYLHEAREGDEVYRVVGKNSLNIRFRGASRSSTIADDVHRDIPRSCLLDDWGVRHVTDQVGEIVWCIGYSLSEGHEVRARAGCEHGESSHLEASPRR